MYFHYCHHLIIIVSGVSKYKKFQASYSLLYNNSLLFNLNTSSVRLLGRFLCSVKRPFTLFGRCLSFPPYKDHYSNILHVNLRGTYKRGQVKATYHHLKIETFI